MVNSYVIATAIGSRRVGSIWFRHGLFNLDHLQEYDCELIRSVLLGWLASVVSELQEEREERGAGRLNKKERCCHRRLAIATLTLIWKHPQLERQIHLGEGILHSRELQVLHCGCVFRERQGDCGKLAYY